MPTPLERHAIYFLLRTMYKEKIADPFGFCHTVAVNTDYYVKDLPELMKQKPINCSLYWWPRTNTLPRIKALTRAMKMLEKKTPTT